MTLWLPSPHGHQYYATFYLLALAVHQGLLLLAGYRRGYPLRSWLLFTTGVLLAFVVGCRLGVLSPAEWLDLLQHPGQPWPAEAGRSALGGAVGAGLAALALRRWLGYGWAALDAFALPMCLALAVQCLGCLLTGCCFGEVATPGLPGLHYAPGTLPYAWQAARGLLPAGAAWSLPVVPSQLYQLLLCLAAAAGLWLTRQRPWPAGSRYLLHGALLVGGRWLVEFWRDPAGEPIGPELVRLGGLSMLAVQWLLLPWALGSLGCWALLRRWGTVAPEPVPALRPGRQVVVVVLLLASSAALAPGLLFPVELLSLRLVLLAALGVEVAHWLLGRRLLSWTPVSLRLARPLGLGAVLLVLLFTNQVLAPRAPSTDSASSGPPSLVFSLGAGQATFDQDVTLSSSSCNGGRTPLIRSGFYHRTTIVGGSVGYDLGSQPLRGLSVQQVGLGLWGGTERIGYQTLDPQGPFLTSSEEGSRQERLFDINPYFTGRTKLFGLFAYNYRIGMHVGNLGQLAEAAGDSIFPRSVKVQPDLSLSVGSTRILFGQADLGQGIGGLNNLTGRLGLGSGFGSSKGGYVLAGMALADHTPSPTMGFVEANLRLGNSNFSLQPYAATDFDRHHQLSLRLQYRLGLGK